MTMGWDTMNRMKSKLISDFNGNMYKTNTGMYVFSNLECEKSANEMAKWKDEMFMNLLDDVLTTMERNGECTQPVIEYRKRVLDIMKTI